MNLKKKITTKSSYKALKNRLQSIHKREHSILRSLNRKTDNKCLNFSKLKAAMT